VSLLWGFPFLRFSLLHFAERLDSLYYLFDVLVESDIDVYACCRRRMISLHLAFVPWCQLRG
jgi:hypothetical protein